MSPLFESLLLIVEANPRPAALNMAIDQALLELARTPVLRVYGWEQPSVSVGYSHELAAVSFDGPVVRRWTGGGMVWHGDDATYSIVVPMSDAWSETRPVESYRLIHGALAECLNAAGHGPCRLADEQDQKTGALCFESPALFDVLRGEQKIAGAGQRRSRAGMLHQGSIKLSLHSDFWRRFATSVAGEWTTASEQPAHVLALANELLHSRYGTPEWSR